MAGREKKADSPYQVQVLDRTIALLETLYAGNGGMSLPELSERLGMHKSTVHRLLMVLERHRLVERPSRDGRYTLGLKLFELGSKAVEGLDLRERARPFVERLGFETGETAHLCILDEGEVLYLEKVEPARTMRVPSNVGRRNPAHCTAVGKVLLAHLSDEAVDALLRTQGLRAHTRNTITTPSELKRELVGIRERGYAVDDEEIEEGLRCIGAPLRDYSGRVVASISIAGPAFRVTTEKVPTLARTVMGVAAELSEALGFRSAQQPDVTASA